VAVSGKTLRIAAEARVSSKRKLRRAQAQHTSAATPRQNPEAARKQTAEQRFSKAGSDKLWSGLLGWDPDRLARAWLAQAIHDGARQKDTSRVVAALEARVPKTSGKLDPEAAANAVEVWQASGDSYDAADPAPKWHLLTNLAAKLGLGDTTPEAYQDDWEAWITLTLAAAPRAALMSALAQAEQAAVALHTLTKSARMGGLVNVSRAMWTALAYGDDASFELLTQTGDEWLGRVGGSLPRAP
jgi:hypothetical protein